MCLCLVKCIVDVKFFKMYQFFEDVGFFVYFVCLWWYYEINNFYIVMVYEKGVEVICMLKMLIGVDSFKVGLDFYFECYDGDVIIIEVFLMCFEDVVDVDFGYFVLWYEQVGIFVVSVEIEYDLECKLFMVFFIQEILFLFFQKLLKFVVILLWFGLIGLNGEDLFVDVFKGVDFFGDVLVLDKSYQDVVFYNVVGKLVLLLVCDFFVLIWFV